MKSERERKEGTIKRTSQITTGTGGNMNGTRGRRRKIYFQ